MADPSDLLRRHYGSSPAEIGQSLLSALRERAANGDENAARALAAHDAPPLVGSSTYLSRAPKNVIGEVLERIPDEAAFASNFVVPGPREAADAPGAARTNRL